MVYGWLFYSGENFELPLTDACNEDLIKKNKKRKPLGSIHLHILMIPMTKEEMNEVGLNYDYIKSIHKLISIYIDTYNITLKLILGYW